MKRATLVNAVSMLVFGVIGICSFIAMCVGGTHQLIILIMSLALSYIFYVDDEYSMSVKQYVKVANRARRIKNR